MRRKEMLEDHRCPKAEFYNQGRVSQHVFISLANCRASTLPRNYVGTGINVFAAVPGTAAFIVRYRPCRHERGLCHPGSESEIKHRTSNWTVARSFTIEKSSSCSPHEQGRWTTECLANNGGKVTGGRGNLAVGPGGLQGKLQSGVVSSACMA